MRLEQILAGTLALSAAARVPVLGADHPDTLTSRSNLAYAYRAAGLGDPS